MDASSGRRRGFVALAGLLVFLALGLDQLIAAHQDEILILWGAAVVIALVATSVPRVPGELRRRKVATLSDQIISINAMRGASVQSWLAGLRSARQPEDPPARYRFSLALSLEDDGIRIWDDQLLLGDSLLLPWPQIRTVAVSPRTGGLFAYPMLRIITLATTADMLTTDPRSLGLLLARRSYLARIVEAARPHLLG